jgi:PKD repeat protein
MKIKPTSIVLFLSLVITFSGCEKEVVEQEKEPVFVEGEGVKLNIEQKIVALPFSSVAEMEPTDTIIYNEQAFPRYEVKVEGVIEEIEKIESGTVIYVPSGDKGGIVLYVYEVKSTKKSVSGEIAVLIKGVQTTLDMYFNYENAIVEFSTPDNRSKVNSKAPNKLKGNELSLGDAEIEFKTKFAGLEFTSSPDALCKLSLSTNLWKSGNSYISVGGSLTIHPAIDLYMQYEPVKAGSELTDWLEAAMVPDALLFMYKDKNYYLGNMKRLWANIYADIDRDMSFNIHLEEKLSLDPIRIPLGMLVIPTVPVSVNVEAAFEIDFSVMGALDLEVYKHEETDIVLGLDLDRDLPDPVWYYEFDQRSESGLKLMAKIELTTGISLVLETEVYVLGVIGPEISARGFLQATASVTAEAGINDPLALNWKLSAEAGIEGKATLNLAAFHLDKATWKMWAMVEKTFSKNIYLAPDHLVIEAGNNQIGTMGQPLPNPVSIGAYDSKNKLIKYLPVPLYFETNNGSTDPQSTVLTSGGIASTTWTLDSENTEQELTVHFKDGLSKKGEVKVSASVNQSPIPVAEFLATATSVTKGESIQFTDLSTNNPTSWSWNFGDGTTSSEPNPSHTYFVAGNYTVSLEVANQYGSDTETKTDFITVTESGNGETTDNGIKYGDFGVTELTYEDDSDWEQVVQDVFGSDYRIADWTDLESYYNNGGDLLALYDGLGRTEYGNSAYVTLNGVRNYSSTRYYFASRHEHNKPGGYLAHDNIDNYLISLGSWYGSNYIMVKRK